MKKFIPFVLLIVVLCAAISYAVPKLLSPVEISTERTDTPEGEKHPTGKGEKDPEPEPEPEPVYEKISIRCIGDIMAHSAQLTAAAIDRSIPKKDWEYDFSDVFEYVAPYLQEADLALGNVETTFSGDGSYTGYPGFDSPDALARDIAGMGIDVALFANNHMLDSKLAGAKRTVQVLNDAGMTVVGARADTSMNRSAIVEVKGVKFGIVAYTYETPLVDGKRTLNGSTSSGMDGAADYINTFRYYNIEKDKESIKNQIDWCKARGASIVICYMHWGNEYQAAPAAQDVNLATYMAENGADIIFASHPHVVQKAEVLKVGTLKEVKASDGSINIESTEKEVPVFYSMGNFVSNQRTESLSGVKNIGAEKARKSEEGIIACVDLTVCVNDGSFTLDEVSYIPLWVDRAGAKESTPFKYRVIPLVGNYTENAFLKASGHVERAKKAFEELKSIVNLVTKL